MAFESPHDLIADEELLYRSVKKNQVGQPSFYSYDEGVLRVSASAFNDRYDKPSVDRALLNGHNPASTQKSPTDGVLVLLTQEIREEKADIMTADGRAVETSYKMDVKPDPLNTPPDINLAHAVVIANPKYETRNAFKKVKERLAFLASRRGWSIKPQ